MFFAEIFCGSFQRAKAMYFGESSRWLSDGISHYLAKISFRFSFLFHGIRLQNRKQNRSLLLQGKRSGPMLYKGFQSREKNVSVTDSLEKEWFITCCFILHRFQHPKIISHTFNSLPQFEWKTNNRRTEGTFSILLAISVLTDFSLSFTFLKQGVTCP